MPLDSAQWQIEILAADKTSQAFAAVDRRMKSLQQTQAQTSAAMNVAGKAVDILMARLGVLGAAYLGVEKARELFQTALKAGDLGEQAA